MRLISLCAFLNFAVIISAPFVYAESHVAELYSAQGIVEARAAAAGWNPAVTGVRLNTSDALRTALKSRAGVLFVDGTLVRLNESTLLELKDSPASSSERAIGVESGTAYFFSREPKKFPRIDTAIVSAAVRGTEFVVKVTPDQVIVSVMDGVVECSNQFGSVQLVRGEEAVTNRGQAPVKRIMVQPQDAVQWALYYPAVLSLSDYADFVSGATPAQQTGIDALKRRDYQAAAAQFGGSDWRDVMGRSIAAYQKGDLNAAFGEIDRFSGRKPAGMLLYTASINLSAGQAQAASAALDEALKEIEQTSGAERKGLFASYYSARSVIALVQNRKEEAAELVGKAALESQSSPAGALARSYVGQAFFDLDDTKESLEQVIRLEPQSALAKARLAEVELGYGHVKEAIKIAEEARSLSAEEVYPSIVLGFAYLSRYETEKATAEFENALRLDATSGLAHLGYGLALIRQGKLEEGRVQIEKAVHLEPNVSIYRSYLGKVFYEEDRHKIAAGEFERAKELDPNDPTPYLYGAFQKLATYNPVGALDDLERSIELNDNRAVYRSSFLLDQDNAVRGASLARTFNTLGFSQAARIEAIKSINKDYTNYSAHLFLAQSTGDNAQLAQSSISENLISSLLSPVNFNFILPSPSSQASLNEYTSLFDRPQMRTLLQGGGRTGDKSMFGEVVNAGWTGDFAYSLRYNADYSDGFRDRNDDSRLQIFSTTTQYQLTPDDKISATFSMLSRDRGSTGIGYDPYENDPDSGLETDTLAADLGYHHRFGPNSDFIASFSFVNGGIKNTDPMTLRPTLLDFDINDSLPPGGYDLIVDQMFRQRSEGYRGNFQHIWNSDLLTTVTGVELLDARISQNENTPITFDEFGIFTGNAFLTRGRHDENAQTAFTYTTLHLGDWADLTGGVDYTHVDLGLGSFFPPYIDGDRSRSQWSPKVGLSIYATPDTTLRTAYFETIGISGVSDLDSIQPTIVGGFNQLLDQTPGSSYASYAFGVDHKWPGSTYIGSEYTHNDVKGYLPLTTDLLIVDIPTAQLFRETVPEELNIYSDEDEIRSYVYQVIGKRFTATLDHSYLVQDDQFFDTERRTHKSRFGINYFDPSGWFAFTSATWRYQELDGYPGTASVTADERNSHSDYWILGAGAGYQLPNRHGSIVFAFQNLLDQSYHFEPTGKEISPIPRFGAGLAFSLNF